MTAAQAKALLALIADLYLLASTPEPAPPVPEPQVDSNGEAEIGSWVEVSP